VHALAVDRAKARKVFVIATEDDPERVDGWPPPTPWTKFVRAALGSRTRRWLDVLAAINFPARGGGAAFITEYGYPELDLRPS